MAGPSWWLGRIAPLALVVALGACASPAPARPPSEIAPAATEPSMVPPELQAIVEGARQEGQLTLIWGEGTLGGTQGVQRIAEGLNRRYGLNLDVQFTPGAGMAPMTTKLVEEMQASRRASTDVMVGYGNHIAEFAQAGVLTPIDWQSWAPHIRSPDLVARNGEAVMVQTAIRAASTTASACRPISSPARCKTSSSRSTKGASPPRPMARCSIISRPTRYGVSSAPWTMLHGSRTSWLESSAVTK